MSNNFPAEDLPIREDYLYVVQIESPEGIWVDISFQNTEADAIRFGKRFGATDNSPRRIIAREVYDYLVE